MTTIKMKPLAQACALVLTAGSLTMGNAIAAPAPAGSTISNQVSVTYQDAFGNSFTDESNIIDITIREVRAATLTSGNGTTQEVVIDATEVRSVHSLKNTGNVTETYTLAASNAVDDTIDGTMMIYLDADNSGDLSQTEIDAGAITEISLDSDQMANLIVVTALPANLAISDTLHVQLTATDAENNVAADVNDVNITFKTLEDNYTDVQTMTPGAGSSCNAYAWVDEPHTWASAKNRATELIYQGQRGHLATMNTAQENAFVANNVAVPTDGSWWMGAYRTINGSAFTDQWVTGENFNYTNWHPGEPNNDAQKGAKFYGTGLWDDEGENAQMSFLVEFELGDCAEPKVEVALTAAKVACEDADNDGATAAGAGLTFADITLEDMAPNECAIMRGTLTNNGTGAAKSMTAYSKIFEDTDNIRYVPNSLAQCEGQDCAVETRTDAEQDDNADYHHTASKKAAFWFPEIPVGGKGTIQYSVKIK